MREGDSTRSDGLFQGEPGWLGAACGAVETSVEKYVDEIVDF